MKNKTYLLSTFLAAVVGIALLACVVVRAFFPAVILPKANIPNLVLLGLIALVLDHYLAPGAKRCYICIPVFSAITFGLLPFAACFVGGMEALKLGLYGGIVFTVITWVYSSIQDCLSSGPAAKAAPIMSAFGVYLAIQALMGMFL